MKTADGPRIPTRPMLYNRKPKASEVLMVAPPKENKGSEAGPSGMKLIKVAAAKEKEKVNKETGM